MIETKVAHEIIEKAVELAGYRPDVRHLDIYTGYKFETECSMYYYDKVHTRYNSQRSIISSMSKQDMDELIRLMKGYNDTLHRTVEALLEGEYSWVDADTFRYCYRAGVDYGYCHITRMY